jgi:hypothetical protein
MVMGEHASSVLLHRKGVRTPPDYDGLMERMARTLGVNIVYAVDSGIVPIPMINMMLSRCAGCGDKDGCRRWLDSRAVDRSLGFRHCANRKLMLHLRNGTTAGTPSAWHDTT